MLVDRIRLKNFRGVRNNLPVNLDAPLTVLYAVNGTGKTTLCDALEWLLTGEIQRLADTDTTVQNWFGDPDPDQYLVEADLRINGSPLTVARTSGGQLRTLRDKWINQSDSDFHKSIIGHQTAAASTMERNKAQREWIRTARFFDGQGLDSIVDPTTEGRTLRRRAFSSLFGVGARQQQRASLARLVQNMTPTWLDAGVIEAEKALYERQKIIAGEGPQDLEVLRLELVARIGRIEEAVGSGAGGYELTTGRVEVSRLRIREHLDALTQALQSEGVVRECFSRVGIQREALTIARAKLDSQATHLDMLSAQKLVLESNLATERSHKVESVASLKHMQGLHTRFPAIRVKLLECLDRWRWDNKTPLSSGEELLTSIAISDSQVSALSKRRDAWQHSMSQAPAWIQAKANKTRAFQEVVTARGQIESLRTRNQIENDISETTLIFSGVQANLDSVAGALARIRSEATTLLSGLKEEHDCPLCGHPYDTTSTLRKAITNRLDIEPAAVVSLSERLQSATVAMTQLHLELNMYDAAVARLNMATTKAQEQDAVTSKAIASLMALGLPPETIDHSDLLGFLSKKLAESKEAETVELSKLSELRAIKEASESLREVSAEIASLQLAIGASENGSILHQPLESWNRFFDGVIAIANQRQTEAIKADETITRSMSVLEGTLQDLREQILQATNSRDSARSEVMHLDEWIKEWGSALSRMGLSGEPSEEEVNSRAISLHVDLEISEERAKALNSLSEEVAEYLRRAQGEDELIRLRKKLEAADALAQRRRSWFDDLRRAIGMLDERQRLDIDSQIGPLQDTIRAIFGRSQAHEVIDQVIVVPQQDGGLDWKVTIGNHEESEMRVLSRGQRQDLALSVFLARAIGMGGTVFMDEPLLHLDDLNRVGLLDTLRVISQEHGERVRVVMTTADRMLVRHFREKFDLLSGPSKRPLLQIVTMTGGPHEGVNTSVEPVMRKAVFDDISQLILKDS